jgi:hypothetical protein
VKAKLVLMFTLVATLGLGASVKGDTMILSASIVASIGAVLARRHSCQLQSRDSEQRQDFFTAEDSGGATPPLRIL